MRFTHLLLTLLMPACGPSFFVVPGGELRGTVVPGTVEDWGFTDTVKRFQLETRPDDPYSVHLNGVSSSKAFYIASQGWRKEFTKAGGGGARWVGYIDADPRVRLRVVKSLYELRAIRVHDEAELSLVRQLNHTKYGTDPNAWEEPPWVYRLDPR